MEEIKGTYNETETPIIIHKWWMIFEIISVGDKQTVIKLSEGKNMNKEITINIEKLNMEINSNKILKLIKTLKD